MVIKKKAPVFATLKKYIFVFSFLAISLVHFAIFWVYINFDTIRLTFYSYNSATDETTFVGLKYYVEFFESIFVQEKMQIGNVYAFWNTFRAIIINLIIFPIALVVAYAFYKKVPGTRMFRVIFYLPSIVSIVILAMAYREMFRAETGPLWTLFSKLGYTTDTWLTGEVGNKTVWPAIYFFAIVNGMGTNVILMSSSMQRIPNEVSEAARLDGCGFFRELFTITVPCIMPTITAWMTMILTSVFGFYLQPMLIASADQSGYTSTIPMLIFNAADTVNKEVMYIATAEGIFLSVIILPITLIMRYVMKKLTPEVTY